MNVININTLPKNLDLNDFISSKIDNGTIDIEFVYVANFKNTKILRDVIEVICFNLGFPDREVSKFILIVDELNNNAIEYGTEEGGENKLRIKSNNKKDHLNIVIEAEDTGKGKDAKCALEMETLRAHQLKLGYGNHKSIRGRGLFLIIVKVVDRLYFKDSKNGGLIVGIKKSIKI